MITQDQKQNILFLYQSHSVAEVSILTGLSTTSIYNIIHESGMKKASRERFDRKKIREDYLNGFTSVDFLAKKYGCCTNTINKALKGIPRKRRRIGSVKRNNTTLDIISDLKSIPVTGLAMSQIARRHNVSRQYVFKIKNQLEKGEVK